jgi:spore germination protein GerM
MSGRKANKDTNKSTGKNKGKGVKPGRKPRSVLLFWMLFFIVMLFIFIVNLKHIRETVRAVFSKASERTEPPPALPEPSELSEQPPAAPPPSAVNPPSADVEPLTDSAAAQEADAGSASVPPESGAPTGTAPSESASQTPSTPDQSAETPAARERLIYFVQIDAEGRVLISPVKRTLPVSASPLTDALNALLQGVTDTERAQGLTSLVPPDVLVQSARVSGGTALVSFNESFMFNGYGAEGYIGQLRQIVWTATEFTTVNDVQILIEGRRIDFLGEGIRIDRPISRASL